MKIAFFSIYLNHHQAVLADELYSLLKDDYVFVELAECKDNKGSLENFSNRPYLLKAWESSDTRDYAMEIARTFDVCVCGGHLANAFLDERMKERLLTFDMGERPLKRGLLNMLSPRLIKSQWKYHTSYYIKPFYRLCCSAYAPNDLYFLHSFKDRCFKWGYFTKVDVNYKVETQNQDTSTSGITPLMWCGRFLKWKHPELPVLLAARLKANGYKFVLDMYGSGEELEKTKKLAKRLDVSDVVLFCGNLPNDQILEAMRKHNIFLFTSDKNEGWGAVLNEAMSNGCAVVASDEIGSAPYLIENKKNGLLFKSGSIADLYQKVSFLIDNPVYKDAMRIEAVKTIVGLWSARTAASRLVDLCEKLLANSELLCLPENGPCSKALPL